MKTIHNYKGIILLLFATIVFSANKPYRASYVLSKVKVECISQCDATGSDQVYVTIPVESINHKISATRSFKPGNIKSFTEIGPNNGSGSTAWFVKPGDKIQIFEKDLLDADDLIREIKVPSLPNSTPQVVTGTNGNGKYKIHYSLVPISL